MKKTSEELQIVFDNLKTGGNEEKGLLLVLFKKDLITRELEAIQIVDGNKLDLTETIIMLLKDKKELEIQRVFEAVKEFL